MSWNDIDRPLIDPGNRYPAEGLRRCESNALRLLRLIPGARFAERTRDCLQIELPSGAEPDDNLVILVTAEGFDVRSPDIEWTCGAYGPARASHRKKTLRPGVTDEELATAVEHVRQKRLTEFFTCSYCGRRVPPERRHSKSVCHGCASKHLGVVY